MFSSSAWYQSRNEPDVDARWLGRQFGRQFGRLILRPSGRQRAKHQGRGQQQVPADVGERAAHGAGAQPPGAPVAMVELKKIPARSV